MNPVTGTGMHKCRYWCGCKSGVSG